MATPVRRSWCFGIADRNKRVRVAALLSKAAAFAGYDYDARGLTHETLYAMREAFLLSRLALRIHDCPRRRRGADHYHLGERGQGSACAAGL